MTKDVLGLLIFGVPFTCWGLYMLWRALATIRDPVRPPFRRLFYLGPILYARDDEDRAAKIRKIDEMSRSTIRRWGFFFLFCALLWLAMLLGMSAPVIRSLVGT